jgi:hypothetical protein
MKNTNNSQSGLFKEFIYLFNLHRQEAPQHPWNSTYKLSDEEKGAVIESIRQFQLGEGSDGSRFLKRAQEFSEKSGHSSYVEAVKLFIEEEQRHSKMLEEFLSREGIAPISSHWVDWCFRSLRHLAGAETAATVLVTAELIARPYYRALRGATASPLLKSICKQIIAEEEVHIEFQAASVAIMQLKRPQLIRSFTKVMHLLFMEATCLIAWREHRSVFVAGNYTFQEFKKESLDGVKLFHDLVSRKTSEFSQRITADEISNESIVIAEQYGKLY